MQTLKTQELDIPVRYLKGVGPEKEKILKKLDILSLEDLFFWFPRRHENRQPLKSISQIEGLDKECVSAKIESRSMLRLGHGRLSVFKALLRDGRNTLFVVYYHQTYLAQVFKPGAYAVLYGKAEKKGRHFEMIHPEYEIFSGAALEKTAHHGRLVPVYPLTEDLTQKSLRQIIFDALENHRENIREFLPEKARRVLSLCDVSFALTQIHFPDNEASYQRAYNRLVFDEFFFLQLDIGLKRLQIRENNPEMVHGAPLSEVMKFTESLPFELTEGQRNAVRDILSDMQTSQPMNRLVQGDVGSGKTAVAAAALYYTVLSGFQGALMAPTEVLAQQLYLNLIRFLEPNGVRIGYLAQEASAQDKSRIYQELALGGLSVVVGTHALLEEKVKFKNLGLAVVDEQHKFGVLQRETLRKKSGKNSHFLLMTATPIPQTLAMTLYGDMDVSVVAGRPKGRGIVQTLWFQNQERRSVYSWCKKILEEGGQAFVVCPLVDAKTMRGVKSASQVYEEAQEFLSGFKIALLHGKMKSQEKSRVMRQFKEGSILALISTVVVEVGVDVPNARFMIIENAEKFGLAQLHQLRGRVGRGAGDSHCVLLSDAASQESVQRLESFVETESGFEIAEKDLVLRGAGDGQKQHGFLKFKIGDLAKDSEIMKKAKKAADALIEKDPQLAAPEHGLIKEKRQKRNQDRNSP